jgi:hypothetical protein
MMDLRRDLSAKPAKAWMSQNNEGDKTSPLAPHFPKRKLTPGIRSFHLGALLCSLKQCAGQAKVKCIALKKGSLPTPPYKKPYIYKCPAIVKTPAFIALSTT